MASDMVVLTKTQQDQQAATTSKPKKASLEVVIEMVTLLIMRFITSVMTQSFSHDLLCHELLQLRLIC